MAEIITKKKRGRKPKNFTNILNKADTETFEKQNSEEEKVILHLPISIADINENNENNNHDNEDTSMFILSEKEEKPVQPLKKQLSTDDSDNTESLRTSLLTCSNIQNYNINKIITYPLVFKKNTKCWWCRNHFNTPAVQLPEDYYNDTFFCIGNFCSYNCMKSYNLELNDNLVFKRESLMNYLYFLTYSEEKQINPAPHWLTLDEYGGSLTIDKFRENFVYNNKEYMVLHPPLISRQMQIEESYKIDKLREVPIDKVNKLYSEIDSDYVIKRNRPVDSNHLNLETTMGLIKTKRRK
jgi:hypothetical protein